LSILIKGMEMPKSCFYCPFREKVNPDDYVCMALNKEFEETFSLIVGRRHENCPLVPVPLHGRLIDADALLDAWDDNHTIPSAAAKVIEKTIIPAEEATT